MQMQITPLGGLSRLRYPQRKRKLPMAQYACSLAPPRKPCARSALLPRRA